MKVSGAQLFLGLGVLALVAAGGRFALVGVAGSGLQARAMGEGTFSAPSLASSAASFGSWSPPSHQSAGSDWIFEVFTPPLIYFDPATQQFTLTPPLEPERSPTFGVVSAKAEKEPYRLQYLGYSGEAGRYYVEVHDRSTGRYARARVGEELEEMDAIVRSFVADRRLMPSADPEGTPIMSVFVSLEVEDLRLGETFVLNREQAYLPGWRVTVVDEGGGTHVLGEGESFRYDGAVFVVSKASALAVTLRRERPDGRLDTERTFSPSAGPAPL